MDFLEEAAPAELWSGGSGGKGAPGRGSQSRCRAGTDLAERKHESKRSKAEGSGLRSLLTSLPFLICYSATIYLRFQVPRVPGTVPSALPRLLHFILRANPHRQFVYPHLLDKETEAAQEVKRLAQGHIAYLSVDRPGFDLSTACLTASVPFQGLPTSPPLRRSGKAWEATEGAEQGNDSSGWEETSLNHVIKELAHNVLPEGGVGINASAQFCVSLCVSACVYICVAVCVSTSLCVCICVCLCVSASVSVCPCVHVSMSVSMCECSCVCV